MTGFFSTHAVGTVLGLFALLLATDVAARQIDPVTLQPLGNVGVYDSRHEAPRTVAFEESHPPGTIVVRTAESRLYLTLGDGKALRYSIGVGREGYTFSGTYTLTRKAEWPTWTPTASMRQRNPYLPAHMASGDPGNPMGARALYIGQTLYRIHGTNERWSVGREMSSGCIRMTNEDVMDLYERVQVGARIVVVQ